MIDLIDVVHAAFIHDMLCVLALELDVRDVLAIRGVILRFLLVLQRLRLEDIKAVDLSLLTLGLLHAHLVDLTTKLAALLGDHSVEFAGEENLPVVGVA